jgi:hypothetical protein
MFTKVTQVAIMLRSNLKIKDVLIIKDVIDLTEKDKETTVENVVNQETEKTVESVEKLENTIKTEELISPKQTDTLFWCIFIIHFGYDEYIEVDRNYGVKELQIKKQIGDFIFANPYKMKNTNYKMTKAAVQEILSELLTSQKDTSMNSLLAFLVFCNINLIMINSTKLLMLEFISNKEEEVPTYVIYKDAYNKYSLNNQALSKEEIDEIKSKTICLENYLKPIKAISNYKVEELEELANKLGIYEKNKKYKKADLYQEIVDACSWI